MGSDIKVDLRQFRKGLNDAAKKQLPFAIAQALTAVAGHAGLAWQNEMATELDEPTPFTVNSVAVKAARKTTLIATVYIKDIATQYLLPFVDGGPHFLGQKRGLLTPKATAVNQYGNLPKSRLATLKAKANVFTGSVRLKNGQTVSGVWQRTNAKGRKGARKTAGVKGPVALKLLIRFSDPLPVTQRLDFTGRTEAAVRAHFDAEFAKAFAAAMASAK